MATRRGRARARLSATAEASDIKVVAGIPLPVTEDYAQSQTSLIISVVVVLGLWAIRRATKDEVKEVSRVNLSAFLWAAFEIKVHERTLGTALESASAKGKVE